MAKLVQATALLVLGCLAFSQAPSQAAEVRLEIGIGGHMVVGAWNPVRLTTRDTQSATLNLRIEQGSLRTGELPVLVNLQVAGGPGISVKEFAVYLGQFTSLSWSLTSAAGVLGSGSIGGRDQDERPLDLVVSREGGRYRAAYGSGARVVDLPAASLPLAPAAYDGVRSVIVDGSSAAPRLEALAAAAAAGAVVVLAGDLPASHAELGLLATGPSSRLGGGAVLTASAAPADAVAAVLGWPLLDEAGLLAAATRAPLVEPPRSAPQPAVLAVAALYAFLALTIVRLFAAPGLLAVIALSALVSLAGWRALRPPEAQLVGRLQLGIVGGALALVHEAYEVFSLPFTVVTLPDGARPMQVQAYRIDDAGAHFNLSRWRGTLLGLPPSLADAPLRLEGDRLVNLSSRTLHDVHLVGYGRQADVRPGASVALAESEEAVLPRIYANLFPLLEPGTLVATSGCEVVCTVWIAVAATAASPAASPADGSTGLSATETSLVSSPHWQAAR